MDKENGKRYLDYRSFLGYIISLSILAAGLIVFSFYSKESGGRLEGRVCGVERRQDSIEIKLDKMNDKLDKLLVRGNR